MTSSPSNYAIGSIIQGKVTRIVTYGAFLEFPNGQSGLLHISEVSDRYVRDIHSFLSVGDELSVRVLAIDPGNGYLRLSLKNTTKEGEMPIKTPAKRKRIPISEDQVDFTKLKEKLPEWISEALKEEK